MGFRWRSGVAAAVVLAWFGEQGVPATAADTQGGLANWFETVAEAERLAEGQARLATGGNTQGDRRSVPEAGAADRVALVAQPAVNINELRGLIASRNQHVSDTKLLDALAKLAKGQRLAKDESDRFPENFKRFLALYFQMRAFVPLSRRDPNLPAVTDILEDAIRAQGDFGEGRILAAACHLYGGDPVLGKQRLDEASKFLNDHWLNVSPPGQDCCACWLALQRPDAVKGYVETLENPKVFPERIMTAYQALLVGNHGWQTTEFNNAKDYYQLVVSKTKVFKNPPAATIRPMIAEVALFFLAAGNDGVRDPVRAEKLLDAIAVGQPTADAWQVRRARAALKATKAEQAVAAGEIQAADGLWQEAVQELTACREDSIPSLDVEIDEQLQAYRDHKVWYRKRP